MARAGRFARRGGNAQILRAELSPVFSAVRAPLMRASASGSVVCSNVGTKRASLRAL